jgi:multidrug efflux pump subunit AcrA (membrane-fusion protein)
MTHGIWRQALMVGCILTLGGTAFAQQAQAPAPVRVRGQIEKVDGNTLTVKARDGAVLTINVADNVRVTNIVKASLADIKPNSYIGVTAMPEADGSQKAIAIHIFMETQRGTGEGHRAWDLRPGSTMTNAAVESTAAGVDGQVLTVKYKEGDKTAEKKVIVPPDAAIVAFSPGDKSELKAGAQVVVFGAQRQPDGTLQAPAVNVGKGITPPM